MSQWLNKERPTAIYVDDLLNAGEHDWGIFGVSLRRAETLFSRLMHSAMTRTGELVGERESPSVNGPSDC